MGASGAFCAGFASGAGAELAKGFTGFAGAAAGAAGLSVPGISILAALGCSGFSAFAKGLVFLSCSDVAKSRPLPELKNLSLAGFAETGLLSISLNLGRASFGGSGAFAVNAGLSNVPPSFGNTGSLEAGFGFNASGMGADLGASVCWGALKGLNADMEESNSKLSNSSLKLSLKPSEEEGSNLLVPAEAVSVVFFSIFSLVSLSLSAIDSVLSPGLKRTPKEESIISSLLSGLLIPFILLKSSGSLGISLISFL